jgi:hypothetical protein
LLALASLGGTQLPCNGRLLAAKAFFELCDELELIDDSRQSSLSTAKMNPLFSLVFMVMVLLLFLE